MLIRGATLDPAADVRIDVRTDGDRIVECGAGLRPRPGEDGLHAHGGWLLPGLHDHHIHLRAQAAAAGSVRVGPPEVGTPGEFAAALRAARRLGGAGQWIRAVGYHESVAGPLDRARLDVLVPDAPVRVQHRTGALWVLNSAACLRLAVADCPLAGVERQDSGRATGRLWRMDDWLGARIGPATLDFAALSARAAAAGVTGFTDATPGMTDADIAGLARAVAADRIRQRVHCMAAPGAADPGVARITLGPRKIILDDTTLPPLDEFADLVRDCHAAGSAVAVHCVTRVQFVLTMAALAAAGVRRGDRVEHGAIVPAENIEWLRAHDIPVVTQPHFLPERAAQYAAEVDGADRPDLWRLRSLRAGGVAVAAGTDAPFGSADPWSAVAAAVRRGVAWAAAEAISPQDAVRLFTGRPDRPGVARVVEPGAAADLTLLRLPPAALADTPPTRDLVAATIVAGTPVYMAD